jgi:ABC-type phosphate/phosphonate transport system substrate-binding protein
MIKRVRWLCAAVAAVVLVAACGGGGSSSSSSTTTTQAAKTTTSNTTTTTTAAATKTTTSTTVSVPPANKAALLASCKSAAKTYTAALGSSLPANFTSEINAICQRVASGNITGAKAIAREVCNQVASALPSGQEKTAVQTACKSIS